MSARDNILTGIIGFSDLSLPLLPAGSQAAKYSDEISKVGQRGILFTQQLHELSRSGHAKPQPGSVPVALATQATRLAATAPAVELASDLAADLVGVAMEAGPLGMILGHLLANAAEAMPAGGRAHVAAEMAMARYFRNETILSSKFNTIDLCAEIDRHPFLAVMTGRYSLARLDGPGPLAGRNGIWARSTSAHGSRASKTRRC